MNAAATLTVDTQAILDALAADWGTAFYIGHINGKWRASRKDGTGEPLTGRTPDDIAAAMRESWATW